MQDALCRVEVTVNGPAGLRGLTLAGRTLGRDMGDLSMRPLEEGRSVYYVAAAGRRLPAINP